MKLAQRNAPILLSLTYVLMSCGSQPTQGNHPQAESSVKTATSGNVTVILDSGLNPQSINTNSGEVTSVKFDSDTLEMTSDEFVIEVRDENAFDILLKRYSGTVLKDGTIPAPPTGVLKHSTTKSNWKLVRLKSPTTTVEALAVSLDKAGAKGKVRVSDQQAVNQMTFLLQNASSEGLTIEANYVLKPQSYASPFSSEQFLGANGYFKPIDSWWLSNRYGGSGDATGAWGEGMDGTGVTIAIIDVGFKKENPDLVGINPTNNQRVNNRSVSGYNFTAGAYDPYNSWGADSTGDIIGNVSWHGQGVADVALGANNNQYGTSGVAPNANAYLFRLGRGSTGYSYYVCD